MKIITIVGNRPQFIKLGVTARRLRQLGKAAPFKSVVVNTGQHYDEMLSDIFFSELEIEAPDYDLALKSGHIVDQIGRMMAPLRDIFETEKPDGLLIYGDTNSTIAGALVAAHLGVPVIHVEGGERLYRRMEMPEEINRIVTDHLADICLTSSRKAMHYLMREGFGPHRCRFVGDPMYDLFKLSGEMLKDQQAAQPADFDLSADAYGLCTIHRAENTQDADICLPLLAAMDAAPLPILLPVHPRLRARLKDWGWAPQKMLRLVDPLGYFDFQSLLRQSRFVVTDSGGVGREAFFAGKPAVIPLENTAWIEAVEAGLAVMTGRSADRLGLALAGLPPPRDVTAMIEQNFGTGDAGARIVDEVAAFITARATQREGMWHRLGRFDQLPAPVDVSWLSHDVFRTIAGHIATTPGADDRLVLDVTVALDGAEQLAQIARDAGADAIVLLDVAQTAYNLADSALQKRLLHIAQDYPIMATDTYGASVLSAVLGRDIGAMDMTAATSDITPDLAPVDVLAKLQSGDATQIRVQPWLWSAVSVSPFEARLRVVDSRVRDAYAALQAYTADTPA